LLEAVTEYKRMTKFGALSRQLQYIGRLMRDIDPESINAKLSAWNGTSREHTAWLHRVEAWRDRLLEDPSALTELLGEYPQADAQHLRTLIRNAQKEKEAAKPPRNYRELFQVLRDIIPEQH
jgi:ribosome-associated protein